MKLGLREAEEDALRDELVRWDGLVSSVLLSVEAVRACARYGSAYADRARAGLDGLGLVPIDATILGDAARLQPAVLRSLDAIHLATALSLDADLGVLIAYDTRLLEAAERLDIAVLAPR